MKTFYRYAALVAGSLLGLCACSSDDDVSEKGGTTPLPQPQVMVSDLTTTGFSLRWEAVEGAGSYVYTFNGGDETTLTDCRVAFGELERQKEYVVAVKAVPRFRDENSESAYSYIHVLTDDLEQLPQPKLTLGCAYASKTLISWTEVPETTLYEYTVDGKTYTTSERMVTLSNLAKDRAYTFSLRAMTSDATRFTNSEPAELPFTTSADDIPAILIAPTLIISDAVEAAVYAASDETYFYDVMPAATFIKYTPEQIMEAYQQYALDFAQKQGISIQLAMASLLKSGTKTIQVTGLTPELSYVAFAFGMDLKGQITRGLSYTQFKTTSDGYSAGPNYGGSDWFRQNFYITNAYLGLTGYGWTNSVWTNWHGEDVTKVRYRTLRTSLFMQQFPDVNDKKAIADFLNDDRYGYQLDESLLQMISTTDGYTSITAASAGTSYTLITLAVSSSGEETLCVNSVTTKTSATAATWFTVSGLKNEQYGHLQHHRRRHAGHRNRRSALCHLPANRHRRHSHLEIPAAGRGVRLGHQGRIHTLHQRRRLCHHLRRGARHKAGNELCFHGHGHQHRGRQTHQVGFGHDRRGARNSGGRTGGDPQRSPAGARIARRQAHRPSGRIPLPDKELPAAGRGTSRRRPLDNHSQQADFKIRVHV